MNLQSAIEDKPELTIIKILEDKPELIAIINVIVSIITAFALNIIKKICIADAIIISLLLLSSLTIMQLTVMIYSIKRQQSDYFKYLPISNEINKLYFNNDLNKYILPLISKSSKCLIKYSDSKNPNSLYHLFSEKIFFFLEECDNNLSMLNSGSLSVVSSMESDKLWKKILCSVSHSFFTTNIATYEGLIGKKIDQSLLDLQKKISKSINKKFVRIFVYNDEDHKKKLQDVFKAQHDSDIIVRYISKKLFDSISDEIYLVPTILSPDFSIIDDKFLYVTHINSTSGKVTRVEVTTDAQRLKAAKIFSESLLDKSEEFISIKV